MTNRNPDLEQSILKGWVKGFNTNNWNEYIGLLSDHYIFEIPTEGNKYNGMSGGVINLFDYLKDKGVDKITTDPIRISSNDTSIVFEFEEPLNNDKDFSFASFALSFDHEKGVITTYREYFGNKK